MAQTDNALTIIDPAKKIASDRPLPLDQPAMDASPEPITIDLAAIETTIEPPNATPNDEPPAAPADRGTHWPKFIPLAAAVAVAALIGGLAGTAGTATYFSGASAQASTAAASDETQALRERVVRLSSELTAIKSSIEAANRAAAGQLSKIGERLDRAEKAQTEPATKLAKVAEGLDRLERRIASPPASEVTGSVSSVEKQPSKPPVVEGWKLHDYRAGRALVESSRGTLFDVGAGSTLPGVGKIETIQRIDGKIIITTPKGIITSSLDSPRRGAYHLRGY